MLTKKAQRWTKADTEKLRAILTQNKRKPSDQRKECIESIWKEGRLAKQLIHAVCNDLSEASKGFRD